MRSVATQAAHHTTMRWAAAGFFLLTLAFFWPTLASFSGLWRQDGMTHGWVIAALVIWLIWRDRTQLLAGRGADPLLLLPLGALSLLWLAAAIAHVQAVHQTAFLLLLMGWGLVLFGRGSARRVVAMAATFSLGLTFWAVLVPLLRRLTTLASGGLTRLVGIPAEIEGGLIHISAGTFLVEDGCAGMNYLLSGLVIATIYAHLLVRSWRAQLAVIGLGAAIAVVGNWIRVTALIVIGHVTEMQAGVIERHGTFGWAVFAIGLVPFFVLAVGIEKRSRNLPPSTASRRAPDDIELPPANRREPGRHASLQAALATAVAIIGPVLYLTIGALPARTDELLGVAELAQGTGWRLAERREERAFQWRPAYQGADLHDSLDFYNDVSHVQADRFLYRKQAPGAKLIGYPNRLAAPADILDDRVVGPVDAGGRRWVRQAVIQTADGPILIWYWYRVGGMEAFSALHAKALEIPAFLRRRRAAELVTLSTACEASDCRSAFETLASFMGSRLVATSIGASPPETMPLHEEP